MTTLTATSTITLFVSSSTWEAVASFERPAEAMAFAARFPKSAGFKVFGANASTRATLTSNHVNGGINEAGIRRYRALIARAEKLGVSIEWHSSSHASRADFEAGLTA